MSYRGITIPIELARFGLVGSKNLAAVPHNALLRALNTAFDQGALTKTGGSAKYNGTPIGGSPKLRGLLDWFPTSTVQRLLVWCTDGTIRRDTGAGTFPDTMKSGLNTSGLPVWAEGGAELLGNSRKAFLTTGLDTVQVVVADAATTRDINATKPADWSGTNQPRFLIPHNGRLWGGFLHRIYGSTTTDHEDFQAAGSAQLPVFAGESSYLQGGISFKSQLFLWKWPLGIYVLDDSSVTLADWHIERVTSGIGLAGPEALCVIDNDVLFLSEVGHLHLLTNVRDGDVSASDLTQANELGPWVRDNIELDNSALERAQAIYYADRKEAHIAVRGRGSATNNLRLIVDLNRRDGPRIRVEDKDICEDLALQRDTKSIRRPISGDDVGTVWKLDQAAKSKAGVGYASEFQTPHDDFGWVDASLATRRKGFQWLECVMQPTGNYDLSVDTILDGEYRETKTFNLGQAGVALGDFVLDTDRLAGDSVRNLRKRISGTARRLSLLGRLSGANQDFSVSLFYVGSKPSGSRT